MSERGDKEKAEADNIRWLSGSSQGRRQRHNEQLNKIIAVIMRRPKRTASCQSYVQRGWRSHHFIYASVFVCFLTAQSLHV